MRETLTVLAGLLVAALLAALIGPGFVDWRAYRPQIEARLSTVLGVETHIDGGIGLRLLPSPRLTLSEVRVGGATTQASAVAVEQLTVELALSALARGEFRFSNAVVEGATISVVVDEAGHLRLPASIGSGLPAQTSLDRLTLRRSALIWREAGKDPLTLAPLSADLSATSLAGPWRIEGEIADASLRITTGAIEPDGRLRAKAAMTGQALQLSFDGNFLLPSVAGGVAPGLEGAFSLSPGGALSLAGRVSGGSRQLDLAGLTLDIGGGAARLEGEGQFLPAAGTGALALRARRLDADALAAALSERAGFEQALAGLPGAIDLSLDFDQMIWRGEDFSAVGLRGRLDESGLSHASASMRVAGALIGVTGSADMHGIAGRLNLKAEDSRRVALALARAGLDPALADLVGTLGQIDADAVGAWDGGRLAFERLLLTGSSGLRLEGSGDIMPERLAAKLVMRGLDLNKLPPAESFTGLVGARDLVLDLALNDARFRTAPPGSARLDLRREGTIWRLSRLAIEGFGGVSVTGAGALLSEGGEISGRIRAPRFETLAALAGPLIPDTMRQALGRTGDGLSRFDAGFRLTRSNTGETGLAVDGEALAGKFALEGRADRAGLWRKLDLRYDLADRRQLFAMLGLPAPQIGGAGQVVLAREAGRLAGSLTGTGLSIALEGDGTAAARLTIQAERPGQVLPEAAAKLAPDGLFDAAGRAEFSADGVALNDLVVNLAGANIRGNLALMRDAGVSGRLSLPRADLRALLGATLGAAPPAAGSMWSSARFAPVMPLGEVKLAIDAATFVAAEGVQLRDARFTLTTGRDGAAIEDLAGAYGGGRVSGRFAIRREGGLGQLSGRIAVADLDLAALTNGALGGRMSGQVEAGGSGESPARLMAGLGGAGSVTLAAASLSRFDPNAYSRVIATTGDDASESDTSRLQDRLGAALDRGSWPLGDVTLPFTLAGGIARLQPLSFERSGLRAEATGTIDLRVLSADLRLGLRPLGSLPKGWPTDAPQVGVAWRGPLSAPQRETDVGALSNAVAARALAREIERVEAFEADARERAMNSRRLRAEREMRENERKLGEFLKAEEERRIAEEKRAEEARRLEEERRVAEERRAEDARKAEAARVEQEARRRAEAEARARAAVQQQPLPGPLVLPGAPRNFGGEPLSQPGGAVPPLAPPLQIQPVPQPLSRTP